VFTAAKDRLTSQAAHAYVAEWLRPYGTLETLRIDSARRRIEIVVQLHGETAAVAVTLERYETVPHERGTALRVLESSASREWLAAVLRDHLHGRPLRLPAWAAALL
jgi:hypothetical protein